MDLQTYIRSLGGPKKFSEKHGVSHRAATAYSCGARRPKPETARRLVQESPLTWDGIFGSTEAA